MGKQEGKNAQMMAISYTNVGTGGTSSPPCKKRKIEPGLSIQFMHLHFANLAADQATEVEAKDGQLYVNGKSWKPSL